MQWLLALSVAAHAQVIFTGEKELRWTNKDCAATASCDLKEARFKARDYKVLIDGTYSYGTGLAAHFRTATPETLEKYAVVQFIRGCQFESKIEDGRRRVLWGISREFYGKNATFRHPRWVFDSTDTDPVYNSDPELGRHFLYRWNKVPGSTEKKSEVLYGRQKPADPELYVLDHPGTAFLSDAWARNVSQDFKTCVYKTADVPKDLPAEAVDLPGALVCFEWSSRYVYNHARTAFETPAAIDPACVDGN
jgi:hypothetical protein